MKYQDIIKLPCKYIHDNFSITEREEMADVIINHYYINGFPYYSLNNEQLYKEYLYLNNFKSYSIEIDNNELQQNMGGLRFVNSFHPEMWSVKCHNALTPMDVYLNRTLFKNSILKRFSLSETPPVDYNIRKSLKVFNGVQSVSNFRPTIAKYIYDTYCNENSIVLDPCAGFGGRLFGAFCCSKISHYVGVDPSTDSYNGNMKMYETLLNIIDKNTINDIFSLFNIPKITLIKEPFEDVILNEKFDLVFTSPPYFNIEQYTNEETQSWVRYKTLQEWIDGFLEPLINKSYDVLQNNGYFILNVDGSVIIDSLLSIAEKTFGKPETIKYMRLSKIMGSGNKKDVSHKLEPIFIFKK